MSNYGTSDVSPVLSPIGERLLRIERMLQRRMWVTTGEFLNALGVSRATLKRDLQMLRVVFGAPITSDWQGRGYRLYGAYEGVLSVLARQVATL
jgi:predicted DNA-binding transcriptional regulator YafY